MSLACIALAAARAQTPSLTTLYTFEPKDNNPSAGVVGMGGRLYGATSETVFTLAPVSASDWTESIIGNEELTTGIAFGPGEQLYGLTLQGGGSPACSLGCGTVFALTPPSAPGAPWTRQVIHSFTGGGDGAFPTGTPLIAPDGTIYGTTQYGGGGAGCSGTEPGCGTVFALSPPVSPGGLWTETVLYDFLGRADGANPGGGLVVDISGALYGTTPVGGQYSKGAVFQLIPPAESGGAWTKTVIYSFSGRDGDGYQPSPGLVAGPGGVLYGSTALGGIDDGGTIFVLYQSTPGVWTERVLYRFEVEGGFLPVPNGSLTLGKNGAVFGTTAYGGIGNPLCDYGCGQVFELYRTSPGGPWLAQVLYRFEGSTDGAFPLGSLVLGEDGALYGTTHYAGDTTCKPPIGCGTVYRLLP